MAASQTGGCGDWSGFGSTSTPSYFQKRPWYDMRSCRQEASTISTHSRKRSELSSTGTPKASNSERSNPRPAPQLTRPPESTSIIATSSARRSGL